MEWFSDGVGEAISKCRREQALFIVYIQDQAQGAGSEVWENSEIQSLMKENKFVALKVFHDSVEYRQFSQLYPVFNIPSVFCIGRKGSVLEMVSGTMNISLLKEKLQRAFEKLGAEVMPQATPLAAEASGGASPSSPDTPEDKTQTTAKYQENIEKRRKEKAEEVIQKEKEQEVKRREEMRNMAKVKEQQEQIKMQTWLNERAKEKELARRAKEEVKAKLLMDKRERQGATRQESVEGEEEEGTSWTPEAVRQRTTITNAPSPQPPSPSSSNTSSDVCRIQLRLPADKTVVKVMKCTDTLATMRHLVAQDLSVSEDKISLCSVYPRRDFTSEMDSLTMQDLQLVPSGVVLVRIKGSAMTIVPGGGVGGVVSTLWSCLVGLFQFLLGLLAFLRKALGRLVSGGGPTPTTPSSRTQENEKRIRKFRQEDYHHDDRHDSDDEDKRKRGTYNGNSTQQQ